MTSLVSICVNLWFYFPSMLVGLRHSLASNSPELAEFPYSVATTVRPSIR